jgi:ribose transport system substrate-binding protein
MRKLAAFACLAFGAIVTAPSGQATAAEGKYVVGVSNTLIGNGWREEMVCSIKAEALASGKVSKLVLANRNGGPPTACGLPASTASSSMLTSRQT